MPAQPHPLIKDRRQLAQHFGGEGVELGVAAGLYSAHILAVSQCRLLWSIDQWVDHHSLAEGVLASRRLVQRGFGRCVPVRATFADACPCFLNDSLDFVYIDGYAHTGQDQGRTLRDWWPKLKRGGIFAGHDYHPEWQATIDVVDHFAALHYLQVYLTQEQPGTARPREFPSWFLFKP